MQKKHLRFGLGFKVLMSTRRGQAAQMTLPPGGMEGGAGNRHGGTDQWLFVVSGTGKAMVEGRPHRLRAGVLLLIERGERHQIHNTGRLPLKTLNFYAPRAYTAGGNELRAARPDPRRRR